MSSTNFYELAGPDLNKVELYINKLLSDNSSYMYPLLLEYLSRGGKRFRPMITILTMGLLGGDISLTIKPASILELFHNFTLVHDDIEDNSLLRRGKQTMHISNGIPVAINAGDALYTIVWKALFDLDIPSQLKSEIGILFSNSFKKVVEGQALELKWYKDKIVSISEEDYFNMIFGKTGSLIQSSCELSTILYSHYNSKLDEKHINSLKSYGMNIGIAFQIRDDVLNLIGDVKDYKKEIGGDISEGKRTLMFSYALEHLSESDKAELKSLILMNTTDLGNINRAIYLIKRSGAIDYAIKKSNELVTLAKSNLDSFKDSEYKGALLNLADFVVNRSH